MSTRPKHAASAARSRPVPFLVPFLLLAAACRPAGDAPPDGGPAADTGVAARPPGPDCEEVSKQYPNPTPEIAISLNPAGKIVVTPAVAVVSRTSGRLDWRSEQPAAVFVQPRHGHQPLADSAFAIPAGGKAGAAANPGAPCGRYKYGVAVFVSSDRPGRAPAVLDPPLMIVP